MTKSLLDALPQAIAERVRLLGPRKLHDGGPPASGRFVLYWMHHAVRGHENPALDAAIVAAGELGLPLLVYQGLGGRHPFDSARHHTFILEGARDVRAELGERGIAHAFWLGDDGGPSPLGDLAADAALVVTEDFPAPPLPRWTAALATRGPAPLWAVDSACIVPMQRFDKAFDRAFRFRSALSGMLEDRLERLWQEQESLPAAFDVAALPFADTDLAKADLAELVARCAVDHSVGRVPHTVGGSVAGYARWQAFRERRLESYAARRNDAAGDGVSRLSPYLHHGHVSPLRIAREAAAIGGKGAEKFLDELIIWRELAHNLCFHHHDKVESLAILPTWARETLAAHASDEREALSWERLARGRSGDPLWDLCQLSLVRHGELHNNVRMTWGKAIPGWSRDPEEALARLIDLNHRYALDGSDPCSYGGLLWCLGLFDRPFTPPKAVLGTVRPRSSKAHAARLDMARYRRKVTAPATGRPFEVLVIGAGIAGLAAARSLSDHGHRVIVVDKGRGPGGRMSTRRSGDSGELRFDHGTQFFTARDRRFRRWLESWADDRLVTPWSGRLVTLDGRGGAAQPAPEAERWIAVPAMNALCRHLASDLEVRFGQRVTDLAFRADRWRAKDSEGGDLGTFDAVVVTAPAAQTADLLDAAAPNLAARARQVEMAPCWAAMVAFDNDLDLPFDAAFVRHSPLAWIALDSAKAGRPAGQCWVLHGSPEWSREHLEGTADEAAEALLAAFWAVTARQGEAPAHLVGHRWRYARTLSPAGEASLGDSERRLAVAGDWCLGERVEDAFLSGCAAAGRILATAPIQSQGTLFD